MPDNSQPVQENVHTSTTVTTDRTIKAQSVPELKREEEQVQRPAPGLGFGF